MSNEARIALAAIRISILVKQTRSTRRLKKQVAELESKKTELANLATKAIAENMYLLSLLEKHEIAPTEFDLIVINEIRTA